MYKPLRSIDWFYVETNPSLPKTTTQEMLEMGLAKRKIKKAFGNKKLNYINFRSDQTNLYKPIEMPLATSYRRDFAAPYAYTPKTIQDLTPDILWNRKPLNDFAVERLFTSEFKFMDDHFINLSPERRKINFFRQIRNQHFPII